MFVVNRDHGTWEKAETLDCLKKIHYLDMKNYMIPIKILPLINNQ